MYAVIESGGKQHKVSEGDIVFMEKLDAEVGASVVFDKVLAASHEGDIRIGAPYLEGASVEAKVISHGKDKKVVVFKYKAKKGYRKKQGHRQPHTKVSIETVSLAGADEGFDAQAETPGADELTLADGQKAAAGSAV